jgi:hypothetical protein
VRTVARTRQSPSATGHVHHKGAQSISERPLAGEEATNAVGDDGGRFVSVVLLKGWDCGRGLGDGSGERCNAPLFLEEGGVLWEHMRALVFVRGYHHRPDVASVLSRCSGDYRYSETLTG